MGNVDDYNEKNTAIHVEPNFSNKRILRQTMYLNYKHDSKTFVYFDANEDVSEEHDGS